MSVGTHGVAPQARASHLYPHQGLSDRLPPLCSGPSSPTIPCPPNHTPHCCWMHDACRWGWKLDSRQAAGVCGTQQALLCLSFLIWKEDGHGAFSWGRVEGHKRVHSLCLGYSLCVRNAPYVYMYAYTFTSVHFKCIFILIIDLWCSLCTYLYSSFNAVCRILSTKV